MKEIFSNSIFSLNLSLISEIEITYSIEKCVENLKLAANP